MSTFFLRIFCLFLLGHVLAVPHRFVEPENDKQASFLRGSVEFIPTDDMKSSSLKVIPLEKITNEEDMQFSRAAVESVPKTIVSQYLPLRSAVEHNPLDDDDQTFENFSRPGSRKQKFLNIVYFSRQSKATNFDAYVIPNSPDQDGNPLYYRSGSPYQQLLDAKTVNQNQQQFGNLKMMGNLRKKEYKVICFTTNWSFYRKGDGKFVPENLNYDLCSHIIYTFATLDPEELIMLEFDPWADVENRLYTRTVKLAKGKPVFLAIGGWTDSTNGKYSKLVADKKLRANFIENAIPFLKRFGFAGLHFDWNYPVCPQSDCKRGNPSDKMHFTTFMRELQTALQQSNLKLSMSVSGYKEIITQAYEFAALSKLVDFMTIMTFDYHGAWEPETGHVSPLYGHENDKYPQYNSNYTIQMLLKLGADKDKIIMGVPFYAQSFTLTSKENGFNAPVNGPGSPGEFTSQPGMLAYNEICGLLKKPNFKKGKDPYGNSGPYITDGTIWAGYDDVDSVTLKAKYVVDNDLGGISAWTVDLDDFNNICCVETFPLLNAINRGLGRVSSSVPKGNDCRKPTVVTPPPAVMTSTEDTGYAGIPGSQTSAATTSSWWSQPSSTTQRPYQPSTATTRRTTTIRPAETTAIPSPVNVMPVVVDNEPCQNGVYKNHPENCENYLICVRDQWIVQYCPSGLFWNNDHQHCDWPQNVKCNEQKTTTTLRPSTSSRATTRATRAPTKTSTSARPQTTASRRPTTTQRPQRPITTTERPTYYETTTMYYTTLAPQTTMRTTMRSTTTTTTTTRKPMKKPPTKCINGQYYSHKDCSRYYICTNFKKIPMSCADGLQWSDQFKTCDYEENVKCVSKKKFLKLLKFENMRTGDYSALLLKAAEGEVCDTAEFLPFPGSCSSYLQCEHSRLIKRTCPDGLEWDSNINSCNWPNGKCQNDELEEPAVPEDEDNSISYNPSSTTKAPPAQGTQLVTIPVHENVKPLSGKYKIVCYFTNWAWYRPGDGKYLPDDIDPNLCTHVVYGFAVLSYDELTIRTHDSWADIDNRFYERVVELKKKGVKVTLAIGGWNDSEGDKYSRLVRNPSARAKFVRHVVEFLEKYGFEGLDLDWEYPVCWQVDCKKGYADEKQNFASFVKELSQAFRPRGLLLSAAVSPSKTVIDAGYDVRTLSMYFDWIAVMCYDYHGQWDKKTGHVAPLYYHPEDDVDFFNTNYTINYWLQLGAPKEKIIMGMPLYGQAFTLADAKNNGLNAKAPGPGQAGEFTRAAGFLAYYEICDRIFNRGWKVVQDPQGRVGPYAYNGNQWVSFDDQAMLKRKVQFIKNLGIGGGMVWALDLDDFKGKCGQGRHPLLKVIHSELQSDSNDYDELPTNEIDNGSNQETPEVIEEMPEETPEVIEEEVENNQEEIPEAIDENEVVPNEPIQPEEEETNEAGEETNEAEGEAEEDEDEDSNEIDDQTEYKVVCYFTNWAWYRPGIGKFKPEDVDPELCTHIVYGFAVLNRETLTIQPHDSWADIDNHFYERVVEFKKRGVKVTIAIGGWNDSAGDKYSRLITDPSARARFIRHVTDFIVKWNFDGLDLDYEYPVCWQVDCTKGKPEEKQGFAQLVKELSIAFKPRGLLLSSAVSPSKKVIDVGYSVPTLSEYFDWIAVMCYDYHGQWDKKTGHVAPMYVHPEDWEKTFNTNFTINYWIEKGADPKKLILGMPMYGQSFSLAERSNYGLNSPTYGGGEAGEETRARGFLSYYEICSRVKKEGWTVVKDSKGRMGPYAYKGDQWVSFDDVHMIRHKSEYVKALGLGGAMIWALDLDDFKNTCECEEYPLLRTINRVLRNYPGPHNNCFVEKNYNKPAPEATTTRRPVEAERPTTPKRTTTRTTTARVPVYEVEDFGDDHDDYPDLDDEHQQGCTNGLKAFATHSDCHKYYVCNHGNAIEMSCGEVLYWNKKTNSCDWPKNVECRQRDDEPIENEVVPSQRPSKPQSTTARTTTKRPTIMEPRPTKPARPSDPFKPTGNNDYMVVCYFTNWAWYRPGIGKYKPDDIDPTLCTHVVYGFAVLNGETLTIRTHDSWADIDNNFYTKVSSLKEKGIKVSIALGGWNDSAGTKYGKLLTTPEARKRFISNVIEFMKKYDFEGLDLDYEYPVCVQVDCTKGKPEEKQGFAEFVKELSIAFKPEKFLLSAAVSPSKKVIDAGYDIPKLTKYFDWIAVMCYDYHGQWDKKTGHVAPLYEHPEDWEKTFNANFSINYWISRGAERKKLVLGMPMYGQSFTLEKVSNNGLNAVAPGPGQAGEFTRSAGFLSFYEICHKINSGGWTVVKDPQGRMGPYAYNDRQWVSYDDVDIIRKKTKFVKDMSLGGAMIWALDLDDFRNRCGCGTHPLLSTINLELNRITTSKLSDCT